MMPYLVPVSRKDLFNEKLMLFNLFTNVSKPSGNAHANYRKKPLQALSQRYDFDLKFSSKLA